MSDVELSVNLFDWFSTRVKEARKSVGTELSTDSELYLTSLLVERARADRADPATEETTLAELHARASQGTPSEQVRTWRALGDRSLYVVGYFEESLSRRTVGADYYCDMGALAYSRADDVFRRWFSDAFGGVFRELAAKFRACTAVVREVRHSTGGDAQPDQLLRWYRDWLETGSEAAAQRLRAHGIVLPARALET